MSRFDSGVGAKKIIKKYMDMKTTCMMFKNDFDLLLESRDTQKISEMILVKERALVEAELNANFLKNRKMYEHSDNELSRAAMLARQIQKLKNALI